MTARPGVPPAPDGESWRLVLPFVVTQSRGGPYEDQAFVAGFQAGQIDRALAAVAAVGGDGLTAMVRSKLGPQLDLIAMHHGFSHVEKVTEFFDSQGEAMSADGWMNWRCARNPSEAAMGDG